MDEIKEIVQRYGKDPSRLLDVLRDIQDHFRFIPDAAVRCLSKELNLSIAEIQGASSFYHFFTERHSGDFTIYLNDSVTSKMMGHAQVARAFEEAAGVEFGETTEDQLIGLYLTPCMGMSDQEPAALINGIPVTNLTPDKARSIVRELKSSKSLIQTLCKIFEMNDEGDLEERVLSEVASAVHRKGEVFFRDSHREMGSAIVSAIKKTRDEVIEEIKVSNLRGRGGAGFPTGMKWQFLQGELDSKKYVICNADEGEPGTFKDRYILSEFPWMMFEGMVIKGYATRSQNGIVYLRSEYTYLKQKLDQCLAQMRQKNFLGKDILGQGFDFDIEIRLGAGSYVCGEETALIESLEGKRGEPRNKPPFPAQEGYLGCPTSVNNVETFCAAAQIVKYGSDWYRGLGTPRSSGTKLLSVSGDCGKPGIFEIEWGMTIQEFLKLVDARDPKAVVVGGPSGKIISVDESSEIVLCNSHLPTAGAMVVIGKDRDLLSLVQNYTEFFVNESCGACTPCRGGNILLLQLMEKINSGLGTKQDLEKLTDWSWLIMSSSRCGLGQTSPNPIVTTLKAFRADYEQKCDMSDNSLMERFDLEGAMKPSEDFFSKTRK